MKPVYKVETYTSTTLDYTITSDAISINIRDTLTDAIGQFTITLPSGNQYEDIAVHDKVKVYLGYDSAPTNPNFVGMVQKIEGTWDEKQGNIRKISGLALGEILLRRLKCGHYFGSQASAIVTEFANDLGLGTSQIASETSTPSVEFVNETYFDAMAKLSDFWINAGTQLKKDFYVDVDNNLVYKNRPLRTAGVESFTVGSNIIAYSVTRSLENLKNSITVFGNWDELFTTSNPPDENWTELLTNWTATEGTLSLDNTDKQVGSYSVRCLMAGSGTSWRIDVYRNLKSEHAFISGNARSITQSFKRLHFQEKCPTASSGVFCYLYAPDTSNYFRIPASAADTWYTHNLTLPTTDSVGGWTAFGSPQANFITGIRWWGQWNAQDYWRIDDLALQGGRFVYKTSDATSITSYAQRDLVLIDDSLQSNTQCEARAKTLLYQRKDPVTQIEITTQGNTNVLVGDQLSLSLPRESISGSYDVISVDHAFNTNGFFTSFKAVQGQTNRTSVTQSTIQEISRLKTLSRNLARDVKLIR